MDLQHMELGKNAAIAPVFAAVALLLAAIGLYAVIAHSVGQRTQEIGVRVALGATASDVRRLVLREGVTPAAIGATAGLAGSLAVNRILQSQLVAVSPHDPLTLAGAIVTLAGVALIASHVPTRRATRIDPIVALRHERQRRRGFGPQRWLRRRRSVRTDANR
jgi:putative ABC transport system permease protein